MEIFMLFGFFKRNISTLFFLIIYTASVSAEYNYGNTNGQLKIEYTDTTNGKTLQTIKKDDTLIAQHCYQNGKRIKDDTPECSTTTGGSGGDTFKYKIMVGGQQVGYIRQTHQASDNAYSEATHYLLKDHLGSVSK